MKFKMNRRCFVKEALWFGIVGVGSTLFTYFVYIFIDNLLPPSVAYVIGYIAGIVLNYILNTTYTFKTNYSVKKLSYFILCHGINLTLSLVLLNLFIYLGVSIDLAPIPMYVICIPINFIMVRHFLNR